MKIYIEIIVIIAAFLVYFIGKHYQKKSKIKAFKNYDPSKNLSRKYEGETIIGP